MSDLPARVETFLAEYFALSPLEATDTGEHAYDGRWPDLTETGRLARIAFVDRWEAELRSLDPAGLMPDDSVARDLLLDQFAAKRFEEYELRSRRWDPLAWVDLIDAGIFPLLVRESAPLAVRLGSVATRLMVDGAFQEAPEARRKWDRARLTAAQLSEYFVGSLELWDLERDVRERLAVAPGDPRGAAAVPPPRVVGGFGETPGFAYRPYLEPLAHGTLPTPVLRRLILGAAAAPEAAR